MKTNVFILCAGKGIKWNNYLGIPKQLIMVNQETLLERTVRLVKEELKDAKIFIVSNNMKFKLPGTLLFEPQKTNFTSETILSTSLIWEERNIILLGDVFYSKFAIKNIVDYNGGIGFFGKTGRSKFGKSPYGEMFGLNFLNAEGQKIIFALNETINYAEKGGWGNIWDLYHYINSLPYNSGLVRKNNFNFINDFTDDFDKPEDYHNLIGSYHVLTGKTSIKKLILRTKLFINKIHRDYFPVNSVK